MYRRGGGLGHQVLFLFIKAAIQEYRDHRKPSVQLLAYTNCEKEFFAYFKIEPFDIN